jgi:ABC transport system ATP-binding/permease protein
MPILDAQSLSKRLGERILFDSVNLTIRRGERVGLVGENGSGKSTLGRVLAGRLDADLGLIHRRREASFEYLPQAPEVRAGESALQHVFRGRPGFQRAQLELAQQTARLEAGQGSLDGVALASEAFEAEGGYGREAQAERLLKALGLVHTELAMERMSGGEQRRASLARTLFAEPEFAIFDEPTNHLDAETIEWFEEYLLETFRGAYLLITHDRFLLNRVVERTLELDRAQLFSYEGGWEDYLVAREARADADARSEANRQNFLRREIDWLRRQPKARGVKQKARVARAEATIDAVAPKARQRLEFKADHARLGTSVLEAKALSIRLGERQLVRDLELRLERGMRLGIVGPSGSGKTTLLRTLLGQMPATEGEVTRGKTVQVAYLDQMKSDLDPNQSVLEAVAGTRPTVELGEQVLSVYSYLGRFGFDSRAARQKVASLSGGERARLSLARLLLEPANLLVLDEPTNDLDVMTLGSLEDLLLSVQGALLLVSHDRYFLDRVATHILSSEGNGAWRLWTGGFSDYVERKRELLAPSSSEAQADAPSKESRRKSTGESVPGVKKLTYGERKELEGLLTRVDQASNDVKRLESELADPTLYGERRSEAENLRSDLERAKSELQTLEERWLSLEERRAAFDP